MKDYFYKCFNCKAEYSSQEIEKELIYICPRCGSNGKNRPLQGVLEIVYDYNELKKRISKDFFLTLKPGMFWEYPYLWPINYANNIVQGISNEELNKLKLNSNNVIEFEYEKNIIQLFDDSRNPTLSYKDRASVLVAVKALQMGIKEISAASTGNAGSSLAGICARLGLTSHIFVPRNIPESKRIQIQSFGANIYIVDGDYDEAFDLCLEISNQKNWYNRNTAFNPLTIEGKKSSVFDLFIYSNGQLPEHIYVPVGDGVIISGIYKGLKELFALGWINKMPKLIAIQAKGSDALYRYLKNNKFNYKAASTIADSISAGAPRNLYMAANAITETNGSVICVSDREIIEAQKEISQKYGILSEPAASATFAGYKKNALQDSILMITGNGLKDISSLETWNKLPPIKSYKNWQEDLLRKL